MSGAHGGIFSLTPSNAMLLDQEHKIMEAKMTTPPLRLIAHRGASALAPENTLAALQRAHQFGASWLEVDVQCSVDGEPWLIHDFTLERTSNGQGVVAGETWDKIKQLDFGSWFDSSFAGEPPLSFAEALTFISEQQMNTVFELKIDEAEATAGENLLAAIGQVFKLPDVTKLSVLPPSIIFSSGSLAMLELVAGTGWPFPLAHTIDHWDEAAVAKAKQLGCQELHCNAAILNSQLVHQLQALGFFVAAYTVNEPEQAEALAEMGVQGIFTDNYERLS